MKINQTPDLEASRVPGALDEINILCNFSALTIGPSRSTPHIPVAPHEAAPEVSKGKVFINQKTGWPLRERGNEAIHAHRRC